MKRILLIALVSLAVQGAGAQVKEGKIIYERKVNMHKRLGPEQESMKNMLPEFDVSKVQLVFADNESIFRSVEEEEDIRENADQDGNRLFIRRMGGGDNQMYKNYATQKAIEQRELGPKKYIIEDSVRKWSWKLDESETKTIKGYTCRKATTKGQQGDVVAWYTDQIACPGGPENWSGLPGMILEVNINNDEMVYTPIEITDKGDKKIVKAPTDGKKITRKEFQKMMEEQFGANPGGGPQIRIIRQ